MPPAIELLNYMTMKAVPLSRIFPKLVAEETAKLRGPVLRLKKTGRAGA